MRVGCIAMCAALLCLPVAAAAQTAMWKEYTYASDGFAVSFPTLPLVQKKNIPTDASSIELHEYVEQINGVSLIVTVSDYGTALAGKDADTQLQGAKNAALKNAGAQLKSEKKFMFDVNPGLEYEAESSAAHFTVRIYLVSSTLYQTLVAAPVGKPYAGTTQFLDSFKLIPKP
jgi:hypothetical protein